MVFKVILYAVLSSLGLFFLKLGAGQEFGIFFSKNLFSIQLNYRIVFGLLFYVLSFLMSLSIMREANLSIFYSVSAGLVYICVGVLSFFVLKEPISVLQLVGMCFILAGIVMMNLKR